MASKILIKKSLLLFVLLSLGAQLVYSVAESLAHQHSLRHALIELKTRVALDAAHLDLGDPKTQQSMNQASVEQYIETLNQSLHNRYAIPKLSVRSINYELSEDAASPELVENLLFFLAPSSDTPSLYLATDQANIRIFVSVPNVWNILTVNWLGLLLAAALSILLLKRAEGREIARQQRVAASPSAFLRIDLAQKQVINLVSNEHFEMQNKPLCFFTALVLYCLEHPNAELLHHKDVPEELINRANKVFARLIELGHTKRKRPDFNANLDKTLSEIRAVLDSVFANDELHKAIFYPPRAQGEGSRSKQHSYALNKIEHDKVEFIGM
ncbi:hypothetical protein [Alteromonas facilis]|uniref:hypothetical protein n=1 Tax=Alteromonas facilis TaxID=2048004 RepID=UPI000C29033E|nr:hypothetical protein [Alteromonas facilis]